MSFEFSSGLFSALERFGSCLECVFVPGCVSELPVSSFERSSVSRVTFGSGSVLKRIGNRAFLDCRRLREIELPASVEVAGDPGVPVRRV